MPCQLLALRGILAVPTRPHEGRVFFALKQGADAQKPAEAGSCWA